MAPSDRAIYILSGAAILAYLLYDKGHHYIRNSRYCESPVIKVVSFQPRSFLGVDGIFNIEADNGLDMFWIPSQSSKYEAKKVNILRHTK